MPQDTTGATDASRPGGIPPAGSYGSRVSSATPELDQYFIGPGILTVTKR